MNCPPQDTNREELQYLELIREILRDGEPRADRTGVGTLAVFARQLRFDLRGGVVPLITTRRIPFRGVLAELLWFLRGSTNSKELESQGVNIWRGNSSREFLNARGLTHLAEGDIGPMYFHNVFHWGAKYAGCHADYRGIGLDQMSRLLEGLVREPHSRRHLLTTYDPAIVDDGALAPCHGIVIQFYVGAPEGDRGCTTTGNSCTSASTAISRGRATLSCHMYQRSMDVGLGACWNFASYAMLVHIIAAKTGLTARELIISTGDTHVYSNHVEQLAAQTTRAPYPFPKIRFDPGTVRAKAWEELGLADFELVGYRCHPAIQMPMAV